MNNLFIMHTQYNLILATGIASRYKNDNNTLVLYAEFTVYDGLIQQLKIIFNKVIIANESFKKFQSKKSELDFIRKCAKKCKVIWQEHFDRVFMSQERIFDLILLKNTQKHNNKVVSYNVEEDAYYSINNKYNDDKYKINLSLKTKIKNFLHYCYLIGYPYNYKEVNGYCYGMYSAHKGANLLFPHLARREMRERENIEVTQEELIWGINTLYCDKNIDYPIGKRYLIVFFDLINRYTNKSIIIQIFKDIVCKAKQKGYTIILKYHPRETEKSKEFNDAYEIDNSVPAEKLLLDLLGKDVTVLGNATTAIIVAAKLKYKVYSVCAIDAPENKKMKDTMSLMGINSIEKNAKNIFI